MNYSQQPNNNYQQQYGHQQQQQSVGSINPAMIYQQQQQQNKFAYGPGGVNPAQLMNNNSIGTVNPAQLMNGGNGMNQGQQQMMPNGMGNGMGMAGMNSMGMGGGMNLNPQQTQAPPNYSEIMGRMGVSREQFQSLSPQDRYATSMRLAAQLRAQNPQLQQQQQQQQQQHQQQQQQQQQQQLLAMQQTAQRPPDMQRFNSNPMQMNDMLQDNRAPLFYDGQQRPLSSASNGSSSNSHMMPPPPRPSTAMGQQPPSRPSTSMSHPSSGPPRPPSRQQQQQQQQQPFMNGSYAANNTSSIPSPSPQIQQFQPPASTNNQFPIGSNPYPGPGSDYSSPPPDSPYRNAKRKLGPGGLRPNLIHDPTDVVDMSMNMHMGSPSPGTNLLGNNNMGPPQPIQRQMSNEQMRYSSNNPSTPTSQQPPQRQQTNSPRPRSSSGGLPNVANNSFPSGLTNVTNSIFPQLTPAMAGIGMGPPPVNSGPTMAGMNGDSRMNMVAGMMNQPSNPNLGIGGPGLANNNSLNGIPSALPRISSSSNLNMSMNMNPLSSSGSPVTSSSIGLSMPPMRPPMPASSSSMAPPPLPVIKQEPTKMMTNGVVAGRPGQPPAMQILRDITVVEADVPASQWKTRIPPLSEKEIEDVAHWLKADMAYLTLHKKTQERLLREAKEISAPINAPWWDKESKSENPTIRTRPLERFDVRYPGSGPRNARRRGGPKREGLKLPRRLTEEDANRSEILVPIRLDFTVDHSQMRDTFIWNLNDPVVTPEKFAQSLMEDYGLSHSYLNVISKSIHDQLNDFKAHSANFDAEGFPLPDNNPVSVAGKLDEEDVQWWSSFNKRVRKGTSGGSRKRRKVVSDVTFDVKQEETVETLFGLGPIDVDDIQDELRVDEKMMRDDIRILIKLDITVGAMKLDDQFEWDMDNILASPEHFAEVYAQELGLGGEFQTAIVHSIREQVQTYQKSLFLVGHPLESGVPVQDDELKTAFLPNITSGTRAMDQVQAFTPQLNYLSDGEIERTEKEREKDQNRRRKRNTRGRRGIALPDREPIRTYRTPAIGFPELDAATLAQVAANSAPTTKRAAAAAASLTIANMVASENGGSYLPQSQQEHNYRQQQPAAQPVPAKEVKPKGLFIGPKLPNSVLTKRADVVDRTPTTAVDASRDSGAPGSKSTTVAESRNAKVIASRKLREAEREAKEKEYADGQHANMIDGVWHCSNCGIPEGIAVGRRKGPLGDKSQCGECGKYWHRHRKPMAVEYDTSPEYHVARMREAEVALTKVKRRRPQSRSNTVPNTPSSEPQTPARHDSTTMNSKSPSSTASSTSEAPLSMAQRVRVNGSNSVKNSPVPAPSSQRPAPLSSPSKNPSASVAPGTSTTNPVPPQWLKDAIQTLNAQYPNDMFETTIRVVNGGSEWRVKCLDCPGKLYTPGPGETLSNYEVHLRNKNHLQRLSERLNANT